MRGGDGNRTRVQGFAGLSACARCYHEKSQCVTRRLHTGMLWSHVHRGEKALCAGFVVTDIGSGLAPRNAFLSEGCRREGGEFSLGEARPAWTSGS
jgi:hypothetical protein